MAYNNIDSKRKRSGFWSFVGYLSFGVLGVLLGAALVYGLFLFYATDAIEDAAPEEAVEEVDEEELDPVIAPERPLTEIIEEVMPAVVGVNRHSFNQRFGQQVEEVGSGSGVVISGDGYIITNQHVIEDADKITVIIQDHGQYVAELIGSDDLTDLALLKIEEDNLTYIELGDSSQSMVGEHVVAIGNPLGYFQQTVTAGIISAVDRQVRIPGSFYAYTYIQTDALINPGNSGGPLLSLEGKIIGINTAKIAIAGVEGIGLAIPSNTAQRVLTDILEYGRVIRPHLGVLIEDWLDYGDRKPDRGVLISDVVPDTPAEESGLLPGDIIVAIDSNEILFLAQLFDRLFEYYPGDIITVTFYRDGEKYDTTLVLGERPEEIHINNDNDIEEDVDEKETNEDEDSEDVEQDDEE